MKVNDGESSCSSSHHNSKPSTNFSAAFLSFVTKALTRDHTGDCSTASDSIQDHGDLQFSVTKSPGSKWTFYNNKSNVRFQDLNGARIHLRKNPGTEITEQLNFCKEQLNVDCRDSEKLDIPKTFDCLDFNQKCDNVSNQHLCSKSKLPNLAGIQLKSIDELAIAKCPKVEQLFMNDDVFNIGNNQVIQRCHENVTDNMNCVSLEHRENHPDEEGQHVFPKFKSSLKSAKIREDEFDLDTRGNYLCHLGSINSEQMSEASGEHISSNYEEMSRSLNLRTANKSKENEPAEFESETLEQSKIKILGISAELNDIVNTRKISVQNEVVDKIHHVFNDDCTAMQNHFDENDKSRVSRYPALYQFGIKMGDNCHKNSWRKKFVKHLVSDKLKTQATRFLNAVDRPKRNACQKRSDEASIGLSRQEENELNKALYASLQSHKLKYRLPTSTVTNQTEDDITETSRTSACPGQNDFFNSRISSIQAQRKFASGSASVNIRKRGKRNTVNSKILVSKKAKTEDFLTFLCLRERTAVFPSLLDFIHVLQHTGSQSKVSNQYPSALFAQNTSEIDSCFWNQDVNQQLLLNIPAEFSSSEGEDRNNMTVESRKHILENDLINNHMSGLRLHSEVQNTKEHQLRSIFGAPTPLSIVPSTELSLTAIAQTDLSSQSTEGCHSNNMQQSSNRSGAVKRSAVGQILWTRKQLSDSQDSDVVKWSAGDRHSEAVKQSAKVSVNLKNRQCIKLLELSKRQIRPSTRAMTAARADELLNLAKQQQGLISSDNETRDLMKLDEILPSVGNFDSGHVILAEDQSVASSEEPNEEEVEEASFIEGIRCIKDQLKERQNFRPCRSLMLREEALESKRIYQSPKNNNSDSKVSLKSDSPETRILRQVTMKCISDYSSEHGITWSSHCKPIQNYLKSSGDDISVGSQSRSISDSQNVPISDGATEISLEKTGYRIPTAFSEFPSSDDKAACIAHSPSYHPSEEQFEDPIQYIELIQSNAESYGMCRVVPPGGWKVDCCISQELRFTTNIQYINRLRHRCGPNSFKTDCIRKHLETQQIQMEFIPLLNGIQVDLVALSKAVKQCGGLQDVIDRNSWSKVAKLMHLPKYDKDKAQRLCQIYFRYLLSYDMLSEDEHQKLEKHVIGRRQTTNYDLKASCFSKGKSRTLSDFFNIARTVTSLYFDHDPLTTEVETEYWRLVNEGERHVAIHMVQIDTKLCGSAFPDKQDSPYSRHGWNFNVFCKNEGSLLHNLGHVEGVTSSTLHVGMLFSTNCWSRHRHYLPFIRYLHTGADVIWYCVPADEAPKFQRYIEENIPNAKDLELGSEQSAIMVSPEELVRHGINVSRVVQKHGEYVIVFPEAFTACVCSGYSISESMYFATADWIPHGCRAVKVMKERGVPAQFSMTKFLFATAFNNQPYQDALKDVLPFLKEAINLELELRTKIRQLSLSRSTASHDEHVQCEICKTICFLSAVVSEQDDHVFCLEHGFSRLQKKKKFSSYKLLYQFEENDLKVMLEKLTRSQKCL